MDHAQGTMHLPAGWRRVASKTRPGEFYYVSPAGPTWRPPGPARLEPFKGDQAAMDELFPAPPPAGAAAASPRRVGGPASATPEASPEASSARRRKFTATSTSRADFVTHDAREGLVERADRMSLFNPSSAPHPKAKPMACSFKTVSQATFVPHKDFKPEPRVHGWDIPGPMKPLGETSTSRSEFVAHHPERHVVTRSRTPPKPQPFIYSSTQRASYNATTAGATVTLPSPGASPRRPGTGTRPPPHHPYQPRDVAPTKADMTSQVFCDAGRTPAPVASPQSSSARRRHGSASGLSLGLTSPGARRTEQSVYRSNFVASAEPPKTHAGLEARDYAHRAWKDGLNKSTPGQFDSSYRSLYAGTKDSAALLRSCHDVDVHVVARAKTHQEFSE